MSPASAIDPLQIHDSPVAEGVLPEPYPAAFAEAHKILAGGDPPWRGKGHDRHLMLPGEVTFLPRPSQRGMFMIIGAITLMFLGLGSLGGAVAMLVQQGLAGLSSALVMGVLGAAMIAGGVVLVLVSRRVDARGLLSGEGLYLFPEALVLRRRPAGCQLYPRARIKLDLYTVRGGAGSSSQASGSGSSHVRLRWTRDDRAQGEQVLMDWDDVIYTTLKAWRR